MTLLDERPIASSGLTKQPFPEPVIPSLNEARKSFSRDAGDPIRVISIQASGYHPGHVEYIEGELNRLLSLPSRWDGHRGNKITNQAAVESAHIVLSLMDSCSIFPQFFPLPSGGIQFEWLIAGNSVEIEVDQDGEAYVLATTAAGESVVDSVITTSSEDTAVIAVENFLKLVLDHIQAAQ